MGNDTFVGKDIGHPAKAGSSLKVSNGFDITAGGADIWGNKDEFHFVYKEHTGNFDFVVRFESLPNPDGSFSLLFRLPATSTDNCAHKP